MGGEAHVVVNGAARHVEAARRRIADLEDRWSRFRPGSEISRLNRCGGRAVRVSPETFTLVEHAVWAWRATVGRYDPTVLPALRAAGYDRDLPLVIAAAEVAEAAAVHPNQALVVPGCSLVTLDHHELTVTLPPGVEIDPGGIGKGLAADLVTDELAIAGAAGSLVNIGGDLRARGDPVEGACWSVAVEDPLHPEPERPLLTVGIQDAGMASSSLLRRRWFRDGEARHHVIDPRSGRPVVGDLVAATAIAGDAWWAEVVTKNILVAGTPASRVDLPGVLVVTVGATGSVELSDELARVVS
jgi:thiamine biosynthesis lipoprotein